MHYFIKRVTEQGLVYYTGSGSFDTPFQAYQDWKNN